ncbi:MAG: energy-coupling factor transporter transmembrane component T [Christensenellales bacterium]|jgi:energy-coupling factor transport system permease protein
MKIDVRYKLLLFIFISIAAFIAKDLLYGSILFSVVAAITFCMGQWKIALRFIGLYLILSIVVMLSSYLPALLAGIILMIALFVRMFLPLFFYARVFIATTTVSETVTALYAVKMPRAFVITLAVAMRFFPTAKEELRQVRNAMHLRGIGFSFRNLITHPSLLLEGFMTPLMVRASTIADELSAASITRGIDNPSPRTAFFV